MREILFRGKRKDNGEWVEGSLVLVTGKCAKIMYNVDVWAEIIFHTVDNKGFVTSHRYAVDPETVGQYTGLTDKNGKKIFEGDIVKSSGSVGVVNFGKHNIDCCGCCYDSHQSNGFHLSVGEYVRAEEDMWECEKLTVLGNIHDNPELLKGAI